MQGVVKELELLEVAGFGGGVCETLVEVVRGVLELLVDELVEELDVTGFGGGV